jgi:hypothetical protein
VKAGNDLQNATSMVLGTAQQGAAFFFPGSGSVSDTVWFVYVWECTAMI